ncbi:MAG: hypothetical protein M1546_06825 [Chloroflexi bacterium]|nr:hypothetical protein [Chloroflexota bacterium]
MSYRIVLTRDIQKQFKELPGHVKPIARQAIAGLIDNPRPSRAKELLGHPQHFRLHIAGKYRLVWLVKEEEQLIEIEYLGPKTPDLYDLLNLARPEA